MTWPKQGCFGKMLLVASLRAKDLICGGQERLTFRGLNFLAQTMIFELQGSVYHSYPIVNSPLIDNANVVRTVVTLFGCGLKFNPRSKWNPILKGQDKKNPEWSHYPDAFLQRSSWLGCDFG